MLRINRQIREEAGPIFYNQRFWLECPDLKMKPSPGHWLLSKVAPSKLTLDVRGELNYADLRPWLKWYNERGIMPADFVFDRDVADQAVWCLFKIAVVMNGQPWEVTKRMLNLGRECVVMKPFWFEDNEEVGWEPVNFQREY